MSAESPTRTVELYVRSLAPQGLLSTQDIVIGRLDELKSTGKLDEYHVVIWGDRLPPESAAGRTPTGQRLRETVTQFQQWATESGMSLGSFLTGTVRSELADEEYTCIQFPMLTLAEYEDGTLQFVSPCSDDDASYTIHDRLDALAADQDVSSASPSAPAVKTTDSGGKS